MTAKSFKDTLLGDHAKSMAVEFEDWVKMNKVKVEFLDKDQIIPRATFSKETLHLLGKPWEKSFVVKLLGKSIRYQMLCRRIHALWTPKGELDVLGLGRDFFLVRFHLQEDLNEVLFSGPWLI